MVPLHPHFPDENTKSGELRQFPNYVVELTFEPRAVTPKPTLLIHPPPYHAVMCGGIIPSLPLKKLRSEKGGEFLQVT